MGIEKQVEQAAAVLRSAGCTVTSAYKGQDDGQYTLSISRGGTSRELLFDLNTGLPEEKALADAMAQGRSALASIQAEELDAAFPLPTISAAEVAPGVVPTTPPADSAPAPVTP